MKKKFDFGNQSWAAGDLVQIGCAGVPGRSGAAEGLGILLAATTESDRQGDLFPAFYVYNLKLQTAKKYYSSDLKLISPVNS
jgi:hypothetical protein